MGNKKKSTAFLDIHIFFLRILDTLSTQILLTKFAVFTRFFRPTSRRNVSMKAEIQIFLANFQSSISVEQLL